MSDGLRRWMSDMPCVFFANSACIDEKIPRLLVVSSGAVSRPASLGYKVRQGLIDLPESV